MDGGGISDTSIYVVGGALVLPRVIDLLTSLFKGSVNRNVEHEDTVKAELKSDVEALEQAHTSFKLDLQRVTLEHANHRESLAESLGNIKGQLERLDKRISESNKELAIELNRKVASTLGTEIPELVRQAVMAMKGRR